jgi:hypothetical protein
LRSENRFFTFLIFQFFHFLEKALEKCLTMAAHAKKDKAKAEIRVVIPSGTCEGTTVVSPMKDDGDTKVQALVSLSPTMYWDHPYNMVYNSVCEVPKDATYEKALKESKYQICMGTSKDGTSVIVPYPMNTLNPNDVERALHCHFKTTWERKTDTRNLEYFDVGGVPVPKDQSLCFGEIRPFGMRQLYEMPRMNFKTGKHFLDLGFGHGRAMFQTFLEYPQMNVTGVELHAGRFWNAYHGALRLCAQNPKMFGVVSFDSTSVGKRFVTIISKVFGNTLTFHQGNMFEKQHIELSKTVDVVFAEVQFAGGSARLELLSLLLQLKSGAAFLLYESLSGQILDSLPEGLRHGKHSAKSDSKDAVDAKDAAEIDEEYHRRCISNVKDGAHFLPFASALNQFPCISTTWGANNFEIWRRTNVDCADLV